MKIWSFSMFLALNLRSNVGFDEVSWCMLLKGVTEHWLMVSDGIYLHVFTLQLHGLTLALHTHQVFGKMSRLGFLRNCWSNACPMSWVTIWWLKGGIYEFLKHVKNLCYCKWIGGPSYGYVLGIVISYWVLMLRPMPFKIMKPTRRGYEHVLYFTLEYKSNSYM